MSRRLALSLVGLLGVAAVVTATVVTVTVSANAATTCRVTYAVVNQWSGGFTGDVSISNTGDQLDGWRLTFDFPAAGQRLTQSWNSTFVQTGQTVTVTNANWNPRVAANGTTNFGFNGTFTDANRLPTRFSLNGAACGSTTDPAPSAPTTTPTRAPASPSAAPSPTHRPSSSPSAAPSRDPGTTPSHFSTLPVGAPLPSSAQCAAAVRATPVAENKSGNAAANRTIGHPVSGASGRMTRVNGDFTGTTEQILRWAACKWGVDEDLVKAQAAIESWWRMDTKGDWGSDATRCAPGHGLGADGKPGTCPESFGLLQIRYPYNVPAFPGAATSSALNADYAYASWRSCYEGDATWLNSVERGSEYRAGDAWGCMGLWFSGRWHTSAAEGYVTRVKDYLSQRIWETPNFQQP